MATVAAPPPSELLRHEAWDDELIAHAGVPIVDSYFVSVGGGLASFAVVDFLRVAGLTTAEIRVLSNLPAPQETFAALLASVRLRPEDRIRSDSMSRIDNIWGFPGYALSEALAERTPVPLWRVLTEPLLCEFFTPRLRTVIAGLERESARIGWAEMLDRCWAHVVRRRTGGGYFVLARRADETVVHRCQHVHLALGYPGPRLLPDLVTYRAACDDPGRMVNGYEPHDHVYEQLMRSPGTVVLRGSGIAASGILAQLIDDRDERGARTEIVHLFRTYVDRPRGPLWFRRPGRHGFAYQPFNYPKAAWGGQLRQRMLDLSGEERARLVASMGGTTTAWRRRWQRQLARGRREGWYRAEAGVVTDVRSSHDGRLAVTVCRDDGAEARVDADFLIDATGMVDDIRQHALIADLLECACASTNAAGRLDVETTFEVRGGRSGAGRIYASGAATLGGALAPVDSISGHMLAAMEICDDLADQGACEFPGPVRSVSQWWRWVRNREP
jgi:hypothetical protein